LLRRLRFKEATASLKLGSLLADWREAVVDAEENWPHEAAWLLVICHQIIMNFASNPRTGH
jgi:hypothetical protein